jgi:hypothetical protein
VLPDSAASSTDTATLPGQILFLVAVGGRAPSAPLANRHRRVRSADDDHGVALIRLRLDLGRRVEDAHALEISESIDSQSAIAVAALV